MDPISALLGLGTQIIEKVIPDPAAKQAAQLELLKLAQSGQLAQLQADTGLAQGQLDVDKAEAANPSFFVSGWRPFIGWICGMGLAYTFIVRPVASPLLQHAYGVGMEQLDMGTLLTLLLGMLGLGGMRTYEKVQGVSK